MTWFELKRVPVGVRKILGKGKEVLAHEKERKHRWLKAEGAEGECKGSQGRRRQKRHDSPVLGISQPLLIALRC